MPVYKGLEYTLVRSRRKTMAMQVEKDGSVVIRAPLNLSQDRIEKVLEGSMEKILRARQKTLDKMEEARDQGLLTREELQELFDRALDYIPGRVAHYAEIMGVSCGRITIRNQKTRWGSCSSRGNLNFNCLLMLTPPEVIDSVVVHELCHLKYMNHSGDFYAEVYRYFPDYDRWDRWLKKNGGVLIRRMTG